MAVIDQTASTSSTHNNQSNVPLSGRHDAPMRTRECGMPDESLRESFLDSQQNTPRVVVGSLWPEIDGKDVAFASTGAYIYRFGVFPP